MIQWTPASRWWPDDRIDRPAPATDSATPQDSIRTLEVLRFPNELRAELAVVSVEYRGQVTEPKDRTTRMEIARLLGRNFVRIEKAQVR
ncbi:hypothetical protein OHB26_39315 (plasmid) [Nocardia sp. NBC_01503]|uniref:hypothetical protein n=1 Tax=Nocardia sp. NBC_01503 TaxID=2975997 RepID=UPI002E7B4199|nr:hypothetical protein [Nocardia sp. NBC_01503]WTL36729.1 hypothetical protein OHB26_39315 [Nocardia sp. NBC_01503]